MRMVCRCFASYATLQMGPRTHWSPMRMSCKRKPSELLNDRLERGGPALDAHLLNAVVSLMFLRCPLIAAFGVLSKFCTLGGDWGELRSSLAPGDVTVDAGGGNVSGNLASKSTSLVLDLVGVVASTWLADEAANKLDFDCFAESFTKELSAFASACSTCCDGDEIVLRGDGLDGNTSGKFCVEAFPFGRWRGATLVPTSEMGVCFDTGVVFTADARFNSLSNGGEGKLSM